MTRASAHAADMPSVVLGGESGCDQGVDSSSPAIPVVRGEQALDRRSILVRRHDREEGRGLLRELLFDFFGHADPGHLRNVVRGETLADAVDAWVLYTSSFQPQSSVPSFYR